MTGRTVIFAGGGSGGHISPGLAIAERLAEVCGDVHALFVCSERAIDREMLEEAGAEFVTIPASPPAMRARAAWRFLVNFQKSRRRVREVLRARDVGCVIALGGFVAAPVVAEARARRVPRLLINLDAPPGKANRWMARRCEAVYSAVPLPMSPGFAGDVVGMPIRRQAIAQEEASACRRELGLDPEQPTLLVTGASQGATSVNQMLIALARSHAAVLEGWQVLHLAGRGADDEVREAYAAAEIPAVVMAFLHEMHLAWGAATVAISRAGANSVAEAAANRVPTIFLPYPHHRDMHQRHNAMPLVDAGGAMIVDDAIDADRNAEHIVPILRTLTGDASKREAMRDALRPLAKVDAAARLAAIVRDRLNDGP